MSAPPERSDERSARQHHPPRHARESRRGTEREVARRSLHAGVGGETSWETLVLSSGGTRRGSNHDCGVGGYTTVKNKT